jgi:YfiH family protein
VTIRLIQPQSTWKGVQLGCTTRWGGLGRPPYDNFNLGLGAGEDIQTVLENRALLRTLLPGDPCWLKQVHGCEVADADDAALFAEHHLPPEVDACVTRTPGKVLAILTADCLPVVLADLDGRVLGAAHAGWRGLAAGVLEQTLRAMQTKYPQARGWQAWIGPGIGAKSFQVGQDVRDAFEGHGADQPGMLVRDPTDIQKWLADLAGLAVWRLNRMGVERVENSGLCTVSDPESRFFSYRRDRQTGRMATLAWLVPVYPH